VSLEFDLLTKDGIFLLQITVWKEMIARKAKLGSSWASLTFRG
jgi:hypothetical protein